MKKENKTTYQKINYKRYQERIDTLLKDPALTELGIKKETLTQTEYNYNLDYITIGNGEYEIFIVGGTHGSEIITVDFVTQLIKNLTQIEAFDPNLFKLNIIPLQNPEGFDITTSIIDTIEDETFQTSSYEYYLRYRTDSLITKALNQLNILMNQLIANKNLLTPNDITKHLIYFTQTNQEWQALKDKRALPNINIFNDQIKIMGNTTTYLALQIKLLTICKITLSKLNPENIHDTFLIHFIHQLQSLFTNQELWQDIKKEPLPKLYQQMFENITITNLFNPKLTQKMKLVYENNPKGSIIIHDSTGALINLNANTKRNPVIDAIKRNQTIYGPGNKNNIKNYFPGPLGIPTKNTEKFEYAIENKALYTLLQKSYTEGKYLAALLYHGTGGLIYYKPHAPLMTEENYQYFKQYNQKLANIYQNETNYKILEESSDTGYGDELRRTFPGVLLIELSKMGGNPIVPYGDEENIYKTLTDNFNAINKLLKYFKKQLKKNTTKRK